MKSLLYLLAMVVLATAMVPRERRALPEPDEALTSPATSSSTATPKAICAHQTPCAWAVYKPFNRFIDFNFTNSYCICGPGLECVQTEDDDAVSAYVYRCREPSEDNENFNAS